MANSSKLSQWAVNSINPSSRKNKEGSYRINVSTLTGLAASRTGRGREGREKRRSRISGKVSGTISTEGGFTEIRHVVGESVRVSVHPDVAVGHGRVSAAFREGDEVPGIVGHGRLSPVEEARAAGVGGREAERVDAGRELGGGDQLLHRLGLVDEEVGAKLDLEEKLARFRLTFGVFELNY